jgi:predicted RNA polymerase sigma factor
MRDVGVAEELAQDALVAALKQWPVSGIPDKPGAWLIATASIGRLISSAATSCSNASM